LKLALSDRSVIAQFEVSSQQSLSDHSAVGESKRKNDFTVWLIFGLSPNLVLSENQQKTQCLWLEPMNYGNAHLFM